MVNVCDCYVICLHGVCVCVCVTRYNFRLITYSEKHIQNMDIGYTIVCRSAWRWPRACVYVYHVTNNKPNAEEAHARVTSELIERCSLQPLK